jgi:hypothetical protein
MRRTILAAVLMAILVVLGGASADVVVCFHADGKSEVESGEHRCCAPGLAGGQGRQVALAGDEGDPCPGCTDTLVSLLSSRAVSSGPKDFKPTVELPAVVTPAHSPDANPLLHLALARANARDPILPRSTPLLI